MKTTKCHPCDTGSCSEDCGCLCHKLDVALADASRERERAEKAEANYDKFFAKARVYGAIAHEWRKALQAFADRGEALAQAALDWRSSEQNGVPMSAVEEMGRLLRVDEENAALRTALAEIRAERYRELIKRAWPFVMKHEATRPCLEWLRDAGAALAETEKEKP